MQDVVCSVKDQKKEFEEQKDEKALNVIFGMLVFLFPETSWSPKMTRFRNEVENRKWRFFSKYDNCTCAVNPHGVAT